MPVTTRALVGAVGIAAGSLVACGASVISVASVDEVERVRITETALEGARLAPEVYARAEHERDLARRSHASGDDVAANLHAEHALAAYSHAVVMARIARATTERADAQATLDATTVQEQSLEATRATLEKEAADLEQRAQTVHARLPAPPSASSPAVREAVRWTQARSLVVEARLICNAARLVFPGVDDVARAQTAAVAMAERIDGDRPGHPSAGAPTPVPIDDAARIRARCVDVLTRARRATLDTLGRADVLLTELSTAGGWDPSRDERGVVVTLRDPFRGILLTDATTGKLKELGRIAAAHPAFAVQVVVHDATTPNTAPKPDGDIRRGDATVQALVAGGASASRVQAELAVADPNDPRTAARTERLDVVFVGD
jgi:hypothetical protein